MNDNSATNRAEREIPSDDQTDALLRGFFRLEVPTELNQPFRRRQLTSVVTPTMATETVTPERRTEQLRPRSVRIVAVATSVAAMALAVLVVITGDHASSHVSTGAGGITQSPETTSEIDKPLLVSPEGDSRKSTRAVGPDGVTLEETDTIELHPQQ